MQPCRQCPLVHLVCTMYHSLTRQSIFIVAHALFHHVCNHGGTGSSCKTMSIFIVAHILFHYVCNHGRSTSLYKTMSIFISAFILYQYVCNHSETGSSYNTMTLFIVAHGIAQRVILLFFYCFLKAEKLLSKATPCSSTHSLLPCV